MEHSIIKEIKEKDVQVYLETMDYGKELYFPVFFPFKDTYKLDYKTLIGSEGRPVAADIVAYAASSPEKTRKIIGKLEGEIPAIRIKRTMDENKINEYNVLRQLADTNQQQILDLVFNDVDFCVNGVLARLEWLCMQALSQGYVTLNKTNNSGVITENNIDFQMKAANKRVIKSSSSNRRWNDATAGNPKPITDIEDIVDAARANGHKLRYALMDLSKWQQFRKTTEVITLLGGTTTHVVKPTLKSVNEFLISQGLPRIIVIESIVDIENENHEITSVNCWTTKYVTFVHDTKQGNVLSGPVAEDTNTPKQCIKAKKDRIIVMKHSEADPVVEITRGLLNAFPNWPSIDKCYRLDTESNAADGLDS